MAAGSSAAKALFGLLAVSAFQNRHKITEMLENVRTESTAGKSKAPAKLLAELGEKFSGTKAGSALSAGLGDLVEQFNQSGHEAQASSWVRPGANEPIEATAMERFLGEDMIAELTEKTGFSRNELIERLTASVPEAVDRYSPDGRLPTEGEARDFI